MSWICTSAAVASSVRLRSIVTSTGTPVFRGSKENEDVGRRIDDLVERRIKSVEVVKVVRRCARTLRSC